MDEVRFEVAAWDSPAYGEIGAVTIFVNGTDLLEMVREIEAPFAARDGKPDLAGSYAGLPSEYIFLASRRLLGEPGTDYAMNGPEGKLAVLGCDCGEPGCWPLLVRIRVGDDTVTGDGFRQPHRKRWRYDGLGPFVFDRSQYLEALKGPEDTI